MNKVKIIPSADEYYPFDLSDNQEEKGKALPLLKTAVFLFIGMGFGCFSGPEGISPFAAAFLSAVPFSQCLPSFIGSTLGFFLCVKGTAAIRYTAGTLLICLYRLAVNKRFSDRESGFLNSTVTFCSLFISGIIHLWSDEISFFPFLLLICEGLIGLISSMLFVRSFNLHFYTGSIGTFSKKDIFSLIMSIGINLMCLCSISLQGLSPGRIFTLVALMFLCLYKGIGFSVAAGAVAGAFLSLSPDCSYLFPALTLSAVVGGFLSDSGQTVMSLSFTGSFFTAALFSGDIADSRLGLIEPVIACGIFLLIPAVRINELEDYLDKSFFSAKDTDNFALADTLKKASLNMEAVAEIVDSVSQKLDKIINPEVNRLFSHLQQRVCDKCEKKSVCWNKSFDCTASDILKILGVEKIGQGKIGLSVRCPQYDLLCNALTAAFPSYSNAIATKNKITEMRRILTDQFSGMSDFLYELSHSISVSRTADKGKSAFLKSAMRDSGISAESVSYFFSSGRATVKIILPADCGSQIKKIGPMLEFITRRRFEKPETEAEDSSLSLLYRERAAYTVKSGYSQRSMKAGRLCGDTVGIFTTEDGLFNFIISDGMGTGSRAAIDSSLTASVVEKLITSRFSYESSCRTVNNALIMKSTDESIATVDALQINPYNCNAVFYKAGGAVSLVRRSEKVIAVEKASLPLGIIRNVPLSRQETELKVGDIVLLVSDGVTNNDWSWINDELLAWSKSDMQSLATHIASLAALKSESSTRDDITVIAVRIEKNTENKY